MITSQHDPLPRRKTAKIVSLIPARPTAAMTLEQMLYLWPVVMAVISANRRPGMLITADLPLGGVAERCGIDVDSFIAELMNTAARADRGECVWSCCCR